MGDDDTRNWLSCLGWGCLTVVVVAVVGVGGCVAYLYKGGSAARSVTDAYLAAVGDGRYDEAYALLGADFADQHEPAELMDFERSVAGRLGQCGERRLSGTSMNREAGRSVTVLTYLAVCEGGPSEIIFTLEQIEGEWVVQGIRYQEPGAMAVLECAQCGMQAQSNARFCSSCGAPVGATGEPPVAATEVPHPEDPQ